MLPFTTASMSSQGQIIIPKEFRERIGINGKSASFKVTPQVSRKRIILDLL